MSIKKLNFILLIMLLYIFLLIVIFSVRPIRILASKGVLNQVPLIYWCIVLVLGTLITIGSYMSHSKLILTLFGIAYYFTLYSYNLFFIIPLDQSDIAGTGFFLEILRNKTHISPGHATYFEYPVFFTFELVLERLLNISDSAIIFIGFFSLLLLIPLFLNFILFNNDVTNNNTFLYFLYPALYILLVFFFINDQFVPQFLGFVYLILVTGCYVKIRKHHDSRIYNILILFYTLCVFTHPFMFSFFLFGLIIERILHNILTTHSTHTFGKKGTPFRYDKVVSIPLLFFIYLLGLLYRFHSIYPVLAQLFSPNSKRGETWSLILHLIGGSDVQSSLSYKTYPLYDLVSRSTYLFIKYAVFILLLILFINLIYSLYKIKITRNNIFDYSIAVTSITFLMGGLIIPVILGQRAIQVIFLGITKHYKYVFSFLRIVRYATLSIIIISPSLFIGDVLVNESIGGAKFIEDVGTIRAGKFVNDYAVTNSTVLVSDRHLYPSSYLSRYKKEALFIYTPKDIKAGEGYPLTEFNLIIYNTKLEKRFEFYGIDFSYNEENLSVIYDSNYSEVFWVWSS